MADTAIIEAGRLILREPKPDDKCFTRSFHGTDRDRHEGGSRDRGQGWRGASTLFWRRPTLDRRRVVGHIALGGGASVAMATWMGAAPGPNAAVPPTGSRPAHVPPKAA